MERRMQMDGIGCRVMDGGNKRLAQRPVVGEFYGSIRHIRPGHGKH
jgi:hypothetical protein